MNILFLNPQFGSNHPEGLDAPMGIMYLGAVLKAEGHTCTLVDHVWEKENDWSKFKSALQNKPDLVLINTQIRFSDISSDAVKNLQSMKNRPPVIAFGPQASTEAPRLIKDMKFDACIIGEPEEVILNVIKNLKTGTGLKSRPGLATLKNPSPKIALRINTDSLPHPDWELVDFQRYIDATHNAVFMASRGLNHEDIFNQPPLIFAKSPASRRSVENVINEIKDLRSRFKGNYMLLFHDEIFTEDREWVIKLCGQLKELKFGVPYWCFSRPDLIDEELCRIMASAGFAGISMGMESGSDRILKLLGKNFTVKKIEKGFRAVQKAGLLALGSVMIGTPGNGKEPDESIDEINLTRDLVSKIHPDILTITLTTPLPGTPLDKNTKGRTLAASPEDYNIYHTWPGKFPVQLNEISPDDLSGKADEIRKAWKMGLLKTIWRIFRLALRNGAFRKSQFAQIKKVVKRKILSNF